MFLYSAAIRPQNGSAGLHTRLGPQSRFGDRLLGIRARYMFPYSAVLKRYVSRLGPQSRFGDKLVGVRVRYMFLYTAVLKRYLSRLVPQSHFEDNSLGSRVRYMFLYSVALEGLSLRCLTDDRWPWTSAVHTRV